MIRKINFLLILIASSLSIFIAINKDTDIVYFLKDISVVLTVSGLYIINKIFKLKINEVIIFIYILFIFMAHFLGVVMDLYSQVFWYDKFTHCLSGVLTAFLAIFLLVKYKDCKKLSFSILFIISFSMLIASCWEIFEYLSSYYFGVDPQKVVLTGVSDTMGDIIVALLGSILVSISYYFEHKNSYNLIIKKIEKLI